MMSQLCFRGARSIVVTVLLVGMAAVTATVARANIPIQPGVTGAVSAVAGTTAVTVDGQTYLIDRNSPAYGAIQGVHVGDRIGLILDGPPGSSQSHVIGIVIARASARSSR